MKQVFKCAFVLKYKCNLHAITPCHGTELIKTAK